MLLYYSVASNNKTWTKWRNENAESGEIVSPSKSLDEISATGKVNKKICGLFIVDNVY